MASTMEGIGLRSHLFSGVGEILRLPWRVHGFTGGTGGVKSMTVTMRDRSKNRKPLQRGRNLSIEAIQAVQALKRAKSPPPSPELERVMDSKFRRLLKFDMVAVLRELLRQNETCLALKVFEEIQKEHWYKPQVRLYSDMIAVMAANGLLEKVGYLYSRIKAEKGLEAVIEGFDSLLEIFLNHKQFDLAMDCYAFMQSIGIEPERSSFRILVKGLESNGEMGYSAVVRQDAYRYYGDSLEFLEQAGEEVSAIC
ncbi:PREDICTED: pentatricopeptide repeat-containing protein At1g62350 [Tarenaya hassleriana]|uniref:pentatricopeptide repeat-containing protein At1g62350 n=1 Tax=Tarenaya hassleriana TaxID=28532 RepID=UPI00053C225B|nr:PREDICTED: pentatricopeptide repeat-containing protein At1g62350 [Tarenaya hassleriana]